MKLKYKLSDLCFYIFWFLLQLGKGLGLVAKDPLFIKLLICGVPFIVGKLLLTKWDRGSLLKCIALNLLGIVITLCSKTTTYWLSLLCITAMKDMDVKRIIKINIFVRGPMFLFRTISAILGFSDADIRYRFENGAISTVRYGLGYGHANTAQFELFMIIVIVFLLYYNRLKIYHYLLALCYNDFIYGYTNSRTPYYLGIVFLVGILIISRKEKYSQYIARIMSFWSSKSWLIGLVFSVCGCVAYNYLPVFRKFGTFSSRFATAVATIKYFDLSLFGTQGVTTDLGLVYLLYNSGLFMTVLFFVATHKLLNLKIMGTEVTLQWAFACLSVFNILEHTTYSVISNGLLLFLVYVLYPKMQRTIPINIYKRMDKETELCPKN